MILIFGFFVNTGPGDCHSPALHRIKWHYHSNIVTLFIKAFSWHYFRWQKFYEIGGKFTTLHISQCNSQTIQLRHFNRSNKSVLFISYKVVKGFLVVNFFLTCFSELKLSWCMWKFFIQPETRFQLDPTKDKEFPHRPPL